MFSKFAIFIAIVLFSATISAENSSTEEAQAALKFLKETMNTGINTAFAAYTSISQAIDMYSLGSKTNETKVIEAYADDYTQQFERIKNASLEKGVDIAVCLDVVENYIKNLGPESKKSFNQCVDMVLESALEQIQSKVMRAINTVFSIAVKDEKQVVQCGDFDGSCLDSAVSKIQGDADLIRHDLATLIQNYVQVYQMYPSTVGDLCISRYIPTTIGKGQSLIDNLQECVALAANS